MFAEEKMVWVYPSENEFPVVKLTVSSITTRQETKAMKKRVFQELSLPKDGSKLSLHFSGDVREHVFPIHELPKFAFTVMEKEPQFCCRVRVRFYRYSFELTLSKLGGGNFSYSDTDPWQDHVYFGSYEFMVNGDLRGVCVYGFHSKYIGRCCRITRDVERTIRYSSFLFMLGLI